MQTILKNDSDGIVDGDAQFLDVFDFDAKDYIAFYSDVPLDPTSALAHFLSVGREEGRYGSKLRLAFDSDLLSESGLVDPTWYGDRARLSSVESSARHYLLVGWRQGLEPSPQFDGAFLRPYFATIGYRGPPAITYLMLQAAGWPVYSTRASAEGAAAVFRDSGWLYPEGYFAGLRLSESGMDPALHYTLVGEQSGVLPSQYFDPLFYKLRNPDVAEAKVSLLAHFLTTGQFEGRRPQPAAARLTYDRSRLDQTRKTVLLVSHQASRTGAPILALGIAEKLLERYNVVLVLLTSGELEGHFAKICSAVVGPLTFAEWNHIEAEYLVERLSSAYDISFVLANTIETRFLYEAFATALIPVVALVHEFPSYIPPSGTIGRALEWVTKAVFPALIVADAVAAEYPNIANWAYEILPQGPTVAPMRELTARAVQIPTLAEGLKSGQPTDPLVVLGCGTVFIRKGVDLFLAAAAAVRRMNPDRSIKFVWVGHGYMPDSDSNYSSYLSEQIERSGLVDRVEILDEVDDLEPFYRAADIFFLCSRLDPLPNVSIDAALRGIPIVAFERGSGMAEILESDETTRLGVVPYLDVGRAAEIIVELADNDEKRRTLGEQTRRLAERTFDMSSYVGRLEEVGFSARGIMEQRATDLATIRNDPMFDVTMFVGPSGDLPRGKAIARFLARSAALGTNKRPTANFYFRRPAAGFHPQTYAQEHPAEVDASENPLADYIRRGKPRGPWAHDVIVPGLKSNPEPSRLRAAAHCHFYYPELAADFLAKLAMNRSSCDLLITTDTEAKRESLKRSATRYEGGEVLFRVVPNRGRDIGPFLTGFREEFESYDVIGHFHSKKTLTAGDDGLGDSWREFLWRHLLGDPFATMDEVLSALENDPQLGLVFPEDPHLPDWDGNKSIAAELAERLEITEPLPPYFDFPVGSMFWAKSAALRPLFGLNLDWTDYPEEPLPIDGTMLHAVERLIPFVARKAGYKFATTYIPGITW